MTDADVLAASGEIGVASGGAGAAAGTEVAGASGEKNGRVPGEAGAVPGVHPPGDDGTSGAVNGATGETGTEAGETPLPREEGTPTPSSDYGSISGQVVGRITGKPIPRVNVICANSSGPTGTVVTDSDGEFFLSNLLPDIYVLEVLDHESSAEVEVRAGETARAVLTIDDRGSIAGRVVDTRGAAVSGASVRLLRDAMGSFEGESTEDAVSSGGDGSFFFLSAPIGVQIKLAAEMTGYAPATKGPFVLQTDVPLEGVELVLTAASAVSGRVTDTGDAPIAGARVEARVMGAWGRGEGEVAITGADGTYTVPHLSPGEWEVEAAATGYSRQKKRCTITGANETVPLDFVLERGDVVRGRVVDSSGGSISGADVGLVGGLVSMRTESVFDGSFEFESVPDGNYNIGAERAGYSPSWKAIETGNDGEPVLVLGDLATLTVRVISEGDRPVEAYSLTLKRRGVPGGLLASARDMSADVTSPNGVYSWRVPALGYQLVVSAEGYQPAYRDIRLEPGDSGPTVEVLLRGGLVLDGLVTAAGTDRPVAGAHVSWYLGTVPESDNRFFVPDPTLLSDPMGVAVSDSGGRFVLDSLPPRYITVLCRAPGYSPAMISGIHPSYPTGPIEFRLEAGVRLFGTVLYRGSPFSAANVVLQPYESLREVPQEWWTETDGRGDFEFESVQPGPYRLVVTRSYDGSVLWRGFVIQVDEQDTSVLVEFPSGEFSAVVTDASSGVQIQEGPVRLKPVDIQSQAGSFPVEIPPILTLKYPDGEGAFTFVCLPAGEYLLEVAVPGYLPVERSVQVPVDGRVSEGVVVERTVSP